MAQADPLKLESMLCFAVYAAEHAFTRFYRPRLDALELTYPQYLAFLVLWEGDGITVKALGDRLFLDSGTITPLIKRLEARGLMQRERDRQDERQVRIYLTEQGRTLREKALAIPLVVGEAVGEALGGDAQTTANLRESLHRLRKQLDAAGA